MAKFLKGNELNSELEKIFEDAREDLILISPFIKLHERYASVLKAKRNDPNLKIVLVFGKNEADLSKSMNIADFEFFKQFPNIQIRYEKRLHAKYYANDSSAILTSMNLYCYSQDNNIEAGVLTRYKAIGGDNLDQQAFEYFYRVIEQSELLFQTEPVFDKGIMGSGLNRKYLESTIKVDKLKEYLETKTKQKTLEKGTKNIAIQIPKAEVTNSGTKTGFCIRTGKTIPFNLKKPMCDEAYISWGKYRNKDFREKFCHFSGEHSNGETTFAKPILSKNWEIAIEQFKLK